jgi:hypothetical protein
MARPKNSSPGNKFEVTLARQSVDMIEELAKRGIYGRTPAEVGGRFIEQALQQFVDPPRLVPKRTLVARRGRSSAKG